jgi:hypothetical protein
MNQEIELRITPMFHTIVWGLTPHDHLFGFLAVVVVQGTAPFRMQLPMTKEMPLEEVVAPALAEAERRHCILDKIVFTAAQPAPKFGDGEFVAKVLTDAPIVQV